MPHTHTHTQSSLPACMSLMYLCVLSLNQIHTNHLNNMLPLNQTWTNHINDVLSLNETCTNYNNVLSLSKTSANHINNMPSLTKMCKLGVLRQLTTHVCDCVCDGVIVCVIVCACMHACVQAWERVSQICTPTWIYDSVCVHIVCKLFQSGLQNIYIKNISRDWSIILCSISK